MSKGDNVRLEINDKVAIITFTRPEQMNALSEDLLTEFRDAVNEVKNNEELLALIITGEGRAFMAGADLKQVTARTNMEHYAYNKLLNDVFGSVGELDIPSIAAINGYAMGGGLELALSCTIRIASEKAKLALPEVTLGLIPSAGGAQRLPRVIQYSKAMKLLLTGETVNAAQALELGMVDEVVPPEELMNAASALAHKIASNAPLAVKAIMYTVNKGLEMPLPYALRHAELTNNVVVASEDAKEGVKSFVEKRKPVYKGK